MNTSEFAEYIIAHDWLFRLGARERAEYVTGVFVYGWLQIYAGGTWEYSA